MNMIMRVEDKREDIKLVNIYMNNVFSWTFIVGVLTAVVMTLISCKFLTCSGVPVIQREKERERHREMVRETARDGKTDAPTIHGVGGKRIVNHIIDCALSFFVLTSLYYTHWNAHTNKTSYWII